MNNSMIRIIIGHIMKIEAAFLLLPCIVALIYGEKEGFVYLAVAAGSAVGGCLLGSLVVACGTCSLTRD